MGFARVGSNPTVVDIFGGVCSSMITVRIRGRVVKALRSGRSQLCWRGFESRRMQASFVLVWSIKMFGWCSWLSRQSNTLKVPSSILGSNILLKLDYTNPEVYSQSFL